MFPYPISFLKAETGLDPGAFVTEWTIPGGVIAADRTIILPAFVTWQATANDYDVDWGDGSSDSNVTTHDKTHEYPADGSDVTYQVVITGQFDSLNMNRATAAQKLMLTKMVQWGTTKWNNLYSTFHGASLMEYEATDAPDLSVRYGYLKNYLQNCFLGCDSIVSLDLTGWDISGVTGLSNFAPCKGLELFDITGWDTSSVTNIGGIGGGMGYSTVSGCEVRMPDLVFNLNQLQYVFNNGKFSSMDLSNWDIGATSKSMLAFLSGAGGVFSLDLSGWTNTQTVTNLSSAFYHGEFTTINMTGWDTSNVTTFLNTFANIPNLTDVIGLNDFRANSATTIKSMFSSSHNLSFDTHNLSNDFGTDLGNSCTNMSNAFYQIGSGSGGVGFPPPNVTNFDTSLCTTFGNMFQSVEFNAPIDVSSWDTSALTGGGWYQGAFYMFGLSHGTTNFDLSGWDFSRLTDMTYWFTTSDAEIIDLGATQDFSSTTIWTNAFHTLGNVSVNFLSTADISATVLTNCFYNSTLLTAQYSNLLIALDTTSGSSGTLGGGSSQYSAGAAATARASLVTKGWTIVDGGAA